MDTECVLQGVILLILLCLSAIFSASETALTTVNRVRLQEMWEDGSRAAGRVLMLLDYPGKMLSAILIANNVVNISASSLATTIALKLWGSTSVAVATGVLTLLVLIFGEITPKTLASLYSLKFSLVLGGLILILRKLLTPVIFLVDSLANSLLKLLHVDASSARSAMTEYEFRSYVATGVEDGVLERRESSMICNVVDFGDSNAKDVMIPRIEMSSVSVDATFEELKAFFLEDKCTRFPVFEGSNDNIVGIINIKDIVFCDESDFSVRKYMREPYFTFEYKKTADLLVEMKDNSVSMTIVVDEYGACVGIVTMEDLLEEIVGEIRDEYDEGEKERIKQVGENEYVVPGSMKLTDINDEFDTSFSSKDFDSIGGLFFEKLDRLPQIGEMLTLDDGTILCVMGMEHNKITSVKITIVIK